MIDYSKLAHSPSLKNKSDRRLYRFLEILPGLLALVVLLGSFVLSFLKPVWVAFFIIIFDAYWLAKVVRLSVRLIVSWKHLQRHIKIDWLGRCYSLLGKNGFKKYYHLVILPTYKESHQIIEGSIQSLLDSDYPTEQMIVALAFENREDSWINNQRTACLIEKKYKDKFKKLLITWHPYGLSGELPGKGSNETWAAKQVQKYLDKEGIPYDKVITSIFDIDTCVHYKYFSCLTYHYAIQPDPTRASYQPIPVFHNNVWQSPALSRLIATQTSFWMMMEQEKETNLLTFSSHSMSFKALVDVGFWQTNIVSEDSRIFYQCWFHYKGDYKVVPLYLWVSMDMVLDKKYFRTLINQYKQQRRWAWGVENSPYVLFRSIKNKTISWSKKLHYIYYEVEGSFSWAVTSLIILLLGWLPVVLGDKAFKATVLASKLPFTTQVLMTLSMLGLLVPLLVYLRLLPKRPDKVKPRRWFSMVLQWVLFPITTILFGSVVALDAQLRLMFGKYMGFFVTPKER